MKLRRKAAIVAVVASLALVLTSCAGTQKSADPTSKPTLTIGGRDDIPSWDPSQSNANDFQQMFQTVYDTILLREPKGELKPMLATSWKYNEDQTALTVKLRKDVTFSDGAKFNASAVEANMANFKKQNGPQVATVANLDSVEAVDKYTVIYHLSQPDPAFLVYLSGTAGLQGSPKAIGTDAIKSDPVGSGPYVMNMAATTAGATYTFVARKGYWNPSLQKFGKVVFKVLTDSTARLNAMLSGQIDAALLDSGTVDQAKAANKTLVAYESDWSGFFIEDRAGSIAPALADVRVRQAINYAIDRKGLTAQILHGLGTPTSQMFGPATPAYTKSLDSYYDYDPAKAKQLMADAGYAAGFSVTLPNTPGLADPALTAVLTQELGAIGIKVTWKTVPTWGDFVTEVSSGRYPFPVMNQIQGDTWVEVQKMIAPTGLYNPLKYTDPKVDQMMQTMKTDPSQFDATAKKLGKYITEQAWFAPFYRLQLLYFTGSNVKVVPEVQVSCPSIYNYSPA